tara:strand:- start:624 stop:779 length:156 start_codon:yes stop_codon:yes gene_type:complete
MITRLDRWLSEEIWWRIKGKAIPEFYTDEDRLDIVKRYWHRAMETEDVRNH